MREQLRQYVELLFAGAPDSEEIKEEILQNTLDRYDDLIDQGKVPEAAYRLAISGIGDINEILGTRPAAPSSSPKQQEEEPSREKRLQRAVAIAMYITSIIPLIALSESGHDTLGFCFTLILVAAATILILMSRQPGQENAEAQRQEAPSSLREELRSSINNLLGILSVLAYLILSALTGAWLICILVFPIVSAIKGLVKAILDLKEANNYEI